MTTSSPAPTRPVLRAGSVCPCGGRRIRVRYLKTGNTIAVCARFVARHADEFERTQATLELGA